MTKLFAGGADGFADLPLVFDRLIERSNHFHRGATFVWSASRALAMPRRRQFLPPPPAESTRGYRGLAPVRPPAPLKSLKKALAPAWHTDCCATCRVRPRLQPRR